MVTPMTSTHTSTGSTIISAIERAYEALQAEHPELPEVVFITGTGLMGANSAKWGHYGRDRWVRREDGSVVTEGGRLPEIFIAGEALAAGAEQTMQTLIHEAVHALAVVREVKETSRDHRYHNKRFVALAEELGMEWPEGKAPHGTIGFSAVVLTEQTKEFYSVVMTELAQAISAHLDTFERLGLRTGDGSSEGSSEGGETPTLPKPEPKKKSRANLKATCGCETPRIIRASASVLEEGLIVCKICGEEFTEAE